MSDRFDDDSLMGDPLAGLGSFIEAPSETPDGEVTTLDVDGLKTFFDPRRDEDHVPIQHVVCTTTHADTALRRLGLLVQRARVGWGCWGRDVEYDARYDVWRDSITSVDAEIISEDVKKRDDDGPRGVIHVVGSLNLADFRAQTKRNTNDGRRAMLQAEAMRDYTPRNPLDSRSGSLSGTPRSVNGHPVLVPSYPAAAIFSRPGHRRSPQPGLDAPSVFTDTDQDKTPVVEQMYHLLARHFPNSIGSLYVFPFAEVQKRIVATCKEAYRTVMYKTYFIKIANLIAGRCGAHALVNGDAWAQVASQTQRNLCTIRSFSVLPVLSPLLFMNKESIIAVAERIGTYQQSICKGTEDCCVMYQPAHPTLKATAKSVQDFVDILDAEDVTNNLIEPTMDKNMRCITSTAGTSS